MFTITNRSGSPGFIAFLKSQLDDEFCKAGYNSYGR